MDYSQWAFSKKGISYQLPPYQKVDVCTNALFNHFKKGLYIRWDSDFDQCDNQDYYHVIKDGDFSMEMLPSKTRNMIRRCLKTCSVQIVDCERVVSGGGYDVYLSETRRYEKNGFAQKPKTKEQWANGMAEAATKGYDIWSVELEGKTICYSMCRKQEKHVNMVTWKCDYENYNHFYPSYGLVYKMVEYYLSQEDIKYVDDGGRSLTEHSAVQDFLISKFGFRKAYTKLNAVFRWWIYLPLMIISPFEEKIKNNQLRSLVRLYLWSR